MSRALTVPLLALLAAACGAATTSGSGSLLPLKLGEIRFHEALERIALHADGRLEVGDKVVGTLGADGHFYEQPGQVRATLGPDGSVRMADTGNVVATISADGTLRIAGKPETLAIEADGSVTGTRLRIVGASPELRPAALFVLVLITQLGSHSAPTP